MRYTILFLFLVVFYSTGCKNSTQSTPETFTDKSEWIYLDDNFSADGLSLITMQDTVTITSSTISNSKKNITFNDATTLTLSPDGSTWILTEFNPSAAVCDLSPFPGKAGDTIMISSDIPIKVNGEVELGKLVVFIKSINTPVVVTAGSFSCSVYEIDEMVRDSVKLKLLAYVSGSAGVVQREYFNTDPKTGNLYLSERKRLIYLK